MGEHFYTLTVGLEDYPTSEDSEHPQLVVDFKITVEAATCDCTQITMDPPPTVDTTTDPFVVNMAYEGTIDPPVAGVNEESRSANAASRACGPNANQCDFDFTTTAMLQGGDNLPEFMSFT